MFVIILEIPIWSESLHEYHSKKRLSVLDLFQFYSKIRLERTEYVMYMCRFISFFTFDYQIGYGYKWLDVLVEIYEHKCEMDFFKYLRNL